MSEKKPVPAVEAKTAVGKNTFTMPDGTKITGRKPLLRDIRKYFHIEVLEERQFLLIADVCSLDEDYLESLTGDEYQILLEKASDFL